MMTKLYCHSNTAFERFKRGISFREGELVIDDSMPDDDALYPETSVEARRTMAIQAKRKANEEALRFTDSDGNTLFAKQPVYSHDRWDEMVSKTVNQILELGHKKGGEYAGDTDRLANFRRNGERLGLPTDTVWAVYAGKHWDAINQFIQDQRNGKKRDRMEAIGGRVDDLLTYLILYKCILDEGGHLTGGEPDRG